MNWPSLAAQCVMCFRTAAAQQAERSRVLNSGIVILLIPPIVVLAGILLLAFRKSGADPPVCAGPPGPARRSKIELLMIPHDTSDLD
jgi:hypothetical protein